MKILLLSRYTEAGASSRYRSYLYLPYLRRKGHEITVAPLLSDLYIEKLYARRPKPVIDIAHSFLHRAIILSKRSNFDLIWLEGEVFPWMPYWVDSMLFNSRVPYVVDYDDALFHKYDLHASAVVRYGLGKKIDHVMHNAEFVIAGNEYLAERASRAGARYVELLPTIVDIDQYSLMPLPENGVFTIGWIGSLSTARYLYGVEEVLKVICKKWNAKLLVVGIRSLDLKDVRFEVISPWSEKIEIEQIMHFDVGIMPLIDSPWERGKCGHKLIKYMSCGRPVVASPVGINSEIVEHGVNGFLASTANDWIDALELLFRSKTLREKMGQAGRQKVEQQYSLNVSAPRLEAVLLKAAHKML